MGSLAQYTPQLITALGSVGAGVGAGLTSPTPYQAKQPYTGDESAQSTLTDTTEGEQSLFAALEKLLSNGTTLPDATVQAPAGVGSLSLNNGAGGLSKPPSLPGLQFPPAPATTSTANTPVLPTPSEISTPVGSRGATTAAAAPIRNTFAPQPSAQPDPGTGSTPTAAALAILRHAAQAQSQATA